MISKNSNPLQRNGLGFFLFARDQILAKYSLDFLQLFYYSKLHNV